MRFARLLVPAVLAAFVLSGCVEDAIQPAPGLQPTSEGTVSRDEARRMGGKTDSGSDICEVFGWYGDEVCDLFCPESDPDCDVPPEDDDDWCAALGWYGDDFCDPYCAEPDPDCDEGGDWCEDLGWYGDEWCDEDCPEPDPDCEPEDECSADADCLNGYCDVGAACMGLDCPPPPPNRCVVPDCDDDSQLLCRMMVPNCPPGQTAAVRDGCYTCVDARTCEEPDPCLGAHVGERNACLGEGGEELDRSCCLGLSCERDWDCATDHGCEDNLCVEPDDCRTHGCAEGNYCIYCWTGFACVPEGAIC